MHFDLPSTTVLVGAYYVAKCAIDSLPNPLPCDSRLYTFLFRFLHALVANFRLASLPPVVPPIPPSSVSVALAKSMDIHLEKELKKEEVK
jgi:hypothetical protein